MFKWDCISNSSALGFPHPNFYRSHVQLKGKEKGQVGRNKTTSHSKGNKLE